MTPSKAAKIAGFKSLKHLADLEGKTSATLINWFNSDRELWDACLARHKGK